MKPPEHTPASLTSAQDTARAVALRSLCKSLMPVWGRHMSNSRTQSEIAVTQMLKAFADIGPHIDMAERQSAQINDALAQPVGGIEGLVGACEQILAPLMQDPQLHAEHRAAVDSVLVLVRRAVGALEQISKPFQHETQMVAEQVDRMYMGFQYQDRISQMLTLLEGDVVRLQSVLADGDATVPGIDDWLHRLESQYAMVEQHHDHTASGHGDTRPDNSETTFF